jgi:hypothetical protein
MRRATADSCARRRMIRSNIHLMEAEMVLGGTAERIITAVELARHYPGTRGPTEFSQLAP